MQQDSSMRRRYGLGCVPFVTTPLAALQGTVLHPSAEQQYSSHAGAFTFLLWLRMHCGASQPWQPGWAHVCVLLLGSAAVRSDVRLACLIACPQNGRVLACSDAYSGLVLN